MIIHKELAAGRWFKLSLIEQLANVGSEIERTINWKRKGDDEASRNAFFRALELLYLTVEDPKNKGRLREVLRTREALIDHFVYDNEYSFMHSIGFILSFFTVRIMCGSYDACDRHPKRNATVWFYKFETI